MVKVLPFWGQRAQSRTHVNTNDRADHLGDNDHVTEVGLDGRGLLVGAGLLLGLAELLDEAHGAALESALEATAGTGVNEVDEGLVLQVQESVELDTAVGVLLEGTGGLLGGGFLTGGKLSLGLESSRGFVSRLAAVELRVASSER